ncbi:hypothetical protein SL053_002648, partial [Flavobacterium psychrophilum]|nr:hypothetical protein [Flavobacterium psychrophilum]
VCQGIVPYSTEHLTKEEIKNRVFHSETKIDDNYGLWIQGRSINRYSINVLKEEYLNYGNWLHRARKFKYFLEDRILIQEITGGIPPRISAVNYTGKLFHDPGIISCLNKSELSTKYLLVLINSKLISWFNIMTSPKGNRLTFPKILIGDIRRLPIFECNSKKQQPFIEKADLMLELNKTLQQQQAKVINMLQRDYGLTKPTKKLDTWYELTVQDFFKELAKAKIVLSAIQKDEVQEYFETYQKQAVATKNQITATDKQIDAMVYELYGLSNEEIEIVENS